MSYLEKTQRVSLTIPTMNRSEFVIRLLHYYAEQKFLGVIFIGDSSDAPHRERIESAVKSLSGSLNVQYRHFPGLKDVLVTQKLSRLVETPYAVYIGDDDFLLAGSLGRCVDFLDENPRYAAASGKAACFLLEGNGAAGRIKDAGFYRLSSLEAPTASGRLMNFLNDYFVSMFAVHRTEIWRRMHQNVHRIDDRSISGELLPSCLSLIQGDSKQLDCLYLIRQVHDQRYLLPDTYDWMTRPGWSFSFALFQDLLVEALVDQGMNEPEARRVCKQAFMGYLGRSFVVENNVSSTSEVSLPHRLLKSFPILRHIWHPIRTFLPGGEMRLQSLLSPRSRYHSDFMPVYKAVTQASSVLCR